MEPTHLLFDFFGTLVEYSAGRIEQRLDRSHAFVTARGARLEYDAFTTHIDTTFDELERRAALTLDEYGMDEVCERFLRKVLARAPTEDELPAFRDTYLGEWCTGVRPIPGVRELLGELAQRFVLVLVTNTHNAAMVRRLLHAIDAAQHFRTVIASDEHGRRKPSACIFERALALSGGTPEKSLYIGDSFEADYRGAAAARLRCLLIDPAGRHPIPEADRLTHILALRDRLVC